jgi:serine/threonine protein kinase
LALDELAREREGKPFSEEELRGLLERVLDALGYLHERGIYHRDIKPGNILITKQNAPVLIDFGSARQRLSERSMTVVESPGYTPFEQLQSRGNVGPWSDLYALGGTLVKVMTGETPPKAMDRMRKDPYQELVGRVDLKSRFKNEFLGAIDKALAVDEEERWQDAREWVGALNIEPFEKQYQSFLKSPHNAFEIPSFAPITGQPTAPSESNLESVSIAIPAHYNQSHLLTKVTFFGRFEIMDARGCMMLYTKNVNEFSRTKAKVFEPNGRKAVITIKARYFVEFREIFDVIDAKTGSRIGAFRRMGFMSSDWLILNANDQEVGRVRQDRKIRELQAYFDEVLVFRFKRIRHPFTRKFNLDFSDDQRGLLDRRLGLAAAVLFCFIKNKPA